MFAINMSFIFVFLTHPESSRSEGQARHQIPLKRFTHCRGREPGWFMRTLNSALLSLREPALRTFNDRRW